jgi:hypothetical protein
MPRDMLSPASGESTVPDMASSGRMVLLIYSGVNGEFSGNVIFPQLTNIIRYANMDFALLSTLAPSVDAGITRVLITYDIACQWNKKLEARVESYQNFSPSPLSKLKSRKVAVPKFHLPAHGNSCQVLYNLSYTKFAGRTDGERIEAGWALANPMATWTRESGPNARRAILDDHWGALNWQKTLRLRNTHAINLVYDLTLRSRCVPRQKLQSIARMVQNPARGCDAHVRQLPQGHRKQMDHNAG